MWSRVKPDGWYGEILPDGRFAYMRPQESVVIGKFDTIENTIPTPNDSVLFMRISPVKWEFAGQSWAGNGNIAWDSTRGWRGLGPSYGTNPVIFDRAGNIDQNDGWAGAQGFRFVEDRIYTADETYADHANRIGEWTRRGEITIGQVAYSVGVLYRGGRYTLVNGSCRNVHFNRSGTTIAVSAFVENVGLHFFIFDESEISGLKREGVVAPSPVVITPPLPPPPKEPVIVPALTFGENKFHIIEPIRSKYPTPLGSRHGEFLVEVARATGLGLLKKSGGTFVTIPDGTKVSQDCLMERNGVHYDILADGEGEARPTWSNVHVEGQPDVPYLTDPRNYYDVGSVVVVPDPVEPDKPIDPIVLPDDRLGRLEARLEILGKHLGAW